MGGNCRGLFERNVDGDTEENRENVVILKRVFDETSQLRSRSELDINSGIWKEIVSVCPWKNFNRV